MNKNKYCQTITAQVALVPCTSQVETLSDELELRSIKTLKGEVM